MSKCAVRRRGMGAPKFDPAMIPGAIHIVSKTSSYGADKNNISNSRAGNWIKQMFVDGIEVPYSYTYDFGDSVWHNVILVPYNITSIVSVGFNCYSGSTKVRDIPESYVQFGDESLRGNEADLVIRSKIMPTFGTVNWAWAYNSGRLFVPAELIDSYKELIANSSNVSSHVPNRIYAIEGSIYEK